MKLNSALEELPSVVYHYTAVATLLAIVNSRSLWATHIDYLNDSKEREHFNRAVDDRWLGFCEEHGKDPGEFNEYMEDRHGDHPFESSPYVVSFSKHGDSLPQWRSYCPAGNGVCIGFSTKRLLKMTQLPDTLEFDITGARFRFDAVEYLDLQDNVRLDAILQEELSVAYAYEDMRGMSIQPQDWFASGLRDRASFIKHPSFAPEAEYRLLASFMTSAPHYDSVKVRPSKTTLIPYVVAEFPDNEPEDDPMIVSVTVGPTPNPQLTERALRIFLDSHGMSADISVSESPYRDL